MGYVAYTMLYLLVTVNLNVFDFFIANKSVREDLDCVLIIFEVGRHELIL